MDTNPDGYIANDVHANIRLNRKIRKIFERVRR